MIKDDYMEANQAIHTPSALLEDTVRRARAAASGCERPAAAPSAKAFRVRSYRRLAGVVACAACFVAFAVSARQLSIFTPVAAIDKSLSLTVGVKSMLPATESAAPTAEEVSEALFGVDPNALFAGFRFSGGAYDRSYASSASETPDARALRFENGDHEILLTVLLRPWSSEPPEGLEKTVSVGGQAVSFAASDDAASNYAFWQCSGHTYTAFSDTLDRAPFIRIIKGAVKQLAASSDVTP